MTPTISAFSAIEANNPVCVTVWSSLAGDVVDDRSAGASKMGAARTLEKEATNDDVSSFRKLTTDCDLQKELGGVLEMSDSRKAWLVA